MAYLINKMDNEIIEEDEEVTEIKEDVVFDITTRPDTPYEQGTLTHAGVEMDDGSVRIERQPTKKYADLTDEQNYQLQQWTKQALAEFPTMDPWWAESISYYCLTKPEEAKDYALNNQDKLYQSAKTQNACWERIEEENPHVKREVKFNE